MSEHGRSKALERFRLEIREEYERRFPASRRYYDADNALLDHTSHAIRWNEPFMPVTRRAEGAITEDLDGHRFVDYWQGHFGNVLGHNPALIRNALTGALEQGRGLQSGMVHEIEAEVAELLCRTTGMETARLTTSGSLGTFYAVVLARAFTGRDRVLKVSGGWHGSQPFGLKGVSAHGTSFDHMESEGLSSSTGAEIGLTRFNDVEALRATFREMGDRIACFLIEPVVSSGGGMPATKEYLTEARRLTEEHGSILLCDEIITGFRFRAGDLSSVYGVRPDLLILGKVVGGGMPVAAVAGREDVMRLATREVGRVKFEGGTYSSHELSLVAAKTMLRHLIEHEDEIYPKLAESGRRLREGLDRIAREGDYPLRVVRTLAEGAPAGSLIFAHLMQREATTPDSPQELAENAHPLVDERMFKATLLLHDLSTRSGLGAVSLAHGDAEIEQTLERYRSGLERLDRAGLL